MTDKLEIKIDNRAVLDALQRLSDLGQNMQPALDAVGYALEKSVAARFETRTDPLGIFWKPWRPATQKSYPFSGSKIARRIGRPGNARLLDRFGDMRGGLSYQADERSVRVGFNQPYAKFHEYGTSRMVRRGLLTADPQTGTLSPSDEEAVVRIVQSHILKAIKGQ